MTMDGIADDEVLEVAKSMPSVVNAEYDNEHRLVVTLLKPPPPLHMSPKLDLLRRLGLSDGTPAENGLSDKETDDAEEKLPMDTITRVDELDQEELAQLLVFSGKKKGRKGKERLKLVQDSLDELALDEWQAYWNGLHETVREDLERATQRQSEELKNMEEGHAQTQLSSNSLESLKLALTVYFRVVETVENEQAQRDAEMEPSASSSSSSSSSSSGGRNRGNAKGKGKKTKGKGKKKKDDTRSEKERVVDDLCELVSDGKATLEGLVSLLATIGNNGTRKKLQPCKEVFGLQHVQHTGWDMTNREARTLVVDLHLVTSVFVKSPSSTTTLSSSHKGIRQLLCLVRSAKYEQICFVSSKPTLDAALRGQCPPGDQIAATRSLSRLCALHSLGESANSRQKRAAAVAGSSDVNVAQGVWLIRNAIPSDVTEVTMDEALEEECLDVVSNNLKLPSVMYVLGFEGRLAWFSPEAIHDFPQCADLEGAAEETDAAEEENKEENTGEEEGTADEENTAEEEEGKQAGDAQDDGDPLHGKHVVQQLQKHGTAAKLALQQAVRHVQAFNDVTQHQGDVGARLEVIETEFEQLLETAIEKADDAEGSTTTTGSLHEYTLDGVVLERNAVGALVCGMHTGMVGLPFTKHQRTVIVETLTSQSPKDCLSLRFVKKKLVAVKRNVAVLGAAGATPCSDRMRTYTPAGVVQEALGTDTMDWALLNRLCTYARASQGNVNLLAEPVLVEHTIQLPHTLAVHKRHEVELKDGKRGVNVSMHSVLPRDDEFLDADLQEAFRVLSSSTQAQGGPQLSKEEAKVIGDMVKRLQSERPGSAEGDGGSRTDDAEIDARDDPQAQRSSVASSSSAEKAMQQDTANDTTQLDVHAPLRSARWKEVSEVTKSLGNASSQWAPVHECTAAKQLKAVSRLANDVKVEEMARVNKLLKNEPTELVRGGDARSSRASKQKAKSALSSRDRELVPSVSTLQLAFQAARSNSKAATELGPKPTLSPFMCETLVKFTAAEVKAKVTASSVPIRFGQCVEKALDLLGGDSQNPEAVTAARDLAVCAIARLEYWTVNGVLKTLSNHEVSTTDWKVLDWKRKKTLNSKEWRDHVVSMYTKRHGERGVAMLECLGEILENDGVNSFFDTDTTTEEEDDGEEQAEDTVDHAVVQHLQSSGVQFNSDDKQLVLTPTHFNPGGGLSALLPTGSVKSTPDALAHWDVVKTSPFLYTEEYLSVAEYDASWHRRVHGLPVDKHSGLTAPALAALPMLLFMAPLVSRMSRQILDAWCGGWSVSPEGRLRVVLYKAAKATAKTNDLQEILQPTDGFRRAIKMARENLSKAHDVHTQRQLAKDFVRVLVTAKRAGLGKQVVQAFGFDLGFDWLARVPGHSRTGRKHQRDFSGIHGDPSLVKDTVFLVDDIGRRKDTYCVYVWDGNELLQHKIGNPSHSDLRAKAHLHRLARLDKHKDKHKWRAEHEHSRKVLRQEAQRLVSITRQVAKAFGKAHCVLLAQSKFYGGLSLSNRVNTLIAEEMPWVDVAEWHTSSVCLCGRALTRTVEHTVSKWDRQLACLHCGGSQNHHNARTALFAYIQDKIGLPIISDRDVRGCQGIVWRMMCLWATGKEPEAFSPRCKKAQKKKCAEEELKGCLQRVFGDAEPKTEVIEVTLQEQDKQSEEMAQPTRRSARIAGKRRADVQGGGKE